MQPPLARDSALEAAADRAALGAILDARGRPHEARQALQQALTVFEKILGPGHYEVGVTLDRLAGVVAATGAHAEAGALYGRALDIFERTLGTSHPRTVTCRANRTTALGRSHP